MGEGERGVNLPPELQQVPSRVLEVRLRQEVLKQALCLRLTYAESGTTQDYVRARLVQFASAFARLINPTLAQQNIRQAAADAISSLPAPQSGKIAFEQRDLQLVFRHDCL